MPDFSMAFSAALDVADAAEALARATERQLDGPGAPVGGLLLSTAAAGPQAAQVGRLLMGRWDEAELLGTSFEGVLAEGRVFSQQPAFALLGWAERPGRTPAGFAIDPDERDVERIAEEVLAAAGRGRLGPRDLVLLFPDAHGGVPIEPRLGELERALGAPVLAGAGASGAAGEPSGAWTGEDDRPGELIGLVVPGAGSDRPLAPLARSARASRRAGAWLEVTRCRARWVDELGGEPALDRLRVALDLEPDEALAPHLDRLLVRIRRRCRDALRPDSEPETDDDGERYVVGFDERREAFSMPVEVERGDRLAVALPDAALARERLREALEALPAAWGLLQFACRTRDAALHGDVDLESAWVSAHAPDRRVLGTLSPFQLGPDSEGRSRFQVHSAVLVSIGVD